MLAQTIAFVLLSVFASTHLASPLSDLDEVRELLLEIRAMDQPEPDLDETVMEIVERVYSPVTRNRFTRTEGDDCGDDWIASCKHEGCEHGTCVALCDAMKLAPDYKEKYVCDCDKGYTAVYCNVVKDKDLCDNVCPNAHRCYAMPQSKSGAFCYDSQWNLINTQDLIANRSLKEMSEMGMFADVVSKIMKRQMSNREQ